MYKKETNYIEDNENKEENVVHAGNLLQCNNTYVYMYGFAQGN